MTAEYPRIGSRTRSQGPHWYQRTWIGGRTRSSKQIQDAREYKKQTSKMTISCATQCQAQKLETRINKLTAGKGANVSAQIQGSFMGLAGYWIRTNMLESRVCWSFLVRAQRWKPQKSEKGLRARNAVSKINKQQKQRRPTHSQSMEKCNKYKFKDNRKCN